MKFNSPQYSLRIISGKLVTKLFVYYACAILLKDIISNLTRQGRARQAQITSRAEQGRQGQNTGPVHRPFFMCQNTFPVHTVKLQQARTEQGRAGQGRTKFVQSFPIF